MSTKGNTGFSVAMQALESGMTEVTLTFQGSAEVWEPEFHRFLASINAVYKPPLEKALRILPRYLEEPVCLKFEALVVQKGVVEPIEDISAIPATLEGTSLCALRLWHPESDQTVVLLGESHLATKAEALAGARIVPYFDHVGCEGVDLQGFFEGRVFFWFMRTVIYPLIDLFTGRSKKNKSPIAQAEIPPLFEVKRNVISLETGWKPGIRVRLFSLVFPLLTVLGVVSFFISSAQAVANQMPWHYWLWVLLWILAPWVPGVRNVLMFLMGLFLRHIVGLGPSRERNMVRNLMLALREDAISEVLVTSGRAHTRPLANLLKREHGFVEVPF